MSRILGIDYGSRRIGLALSDPLELLASPHATLKRTSERADLERLAKIVADYEVRAVVIGLPLRTDGKPGRQVERVRRFADKLQRKLSVPLIEVDERLTTRQAERALLEADLSRRRRKDRVDKVAAAILLQRYLDAQRLAGSDTVPESHSP